MDGGTIVPRSLKGTVSRDVLLQVFFHESPSPKPLKIILGSFKFFLKFATGIDDTGGKFCHQFRLCSWHRWQIIGTISGCRNLKVNLKAKIYIYVSSTTQRGPNKIIKIFLIEDFFHQRHRWQTLSCEYLREFSKKFEMVLMEYSGAGGKLIHEKNQKQKISWYCPFKTNGNKKNSS